MSTLKIKDHELLPFGLDSKPVMDAYLRELNLDISDYTFAANYIWLTHLSGFYTIIEDTFCFFVLANGDLSMLLPPLGRKENVVRAMQACFRIMEDNNASAGSTKVEYIDESMLGWFVNDIEDGAEIFDPFADYVVERALVDYVYECDDLIGLRGNAYATKRNEINKFTRIHPDHRVELLDPTLHAAGISRLMNHWISERMKYLPAEQTDWYIDGIHYERQAVKRMLRDYQALDLIGLVIVIDEQLASFTVGERINPKTASVIIEKTDFNVLGVAQFIFREFAKLLSREYGVTHINVGDDMGFENLKKVKLSYRPSQLIPKYTVYQRQV